MTGLQHARKISDIARYWAQAVPHRVAIHEDGERIDFGQLWARVQQAQAFFVERGVVAGDRVMVISENCTAVIVALFALSELGAWPVVTNARLSEREVEAIRSHCEPRLMVFTHAVSPDAVRHGVRYRAREIDAPGLGAVMAGGTDAACAAEPPEVAGQVAALIYTSGTTGKPKGVMATHRGLLHYARVTSSSRRMTPDDCAYAVMPMSHIFGLATLLLATIQAGGSLYLRARFDPKEVIDAVVADEISILQGVPTMFTRILAHLRESGRTVPASHLRYLYTGGGPLDPTLKRDVEATFGQPLHHGYGMTEYAGSLFITRMDQPRQDCSSGQIVEGAELRVVDEHGQPVAPGQPGELWVRGPGVMLGYYRAPAQTAEVLRPDGWLNTGDIGRVEADGALFIVGRTKDLIIHSGFNVYPIEVESVINTHPAIRQSAVVGRSTPDRNEDVIAFVELKPGMTFDEDELHDYLAERLSPYKRPARIVCLDAIPTTASGKLLKQGLRALAQETATS